MKIGATIGEPTFRVTRSRAAACQSLVGAVRNLHKNSKRTVQDENNSNDNVANGAQNKRRAMLKDVTNICCDDSYKNCIIPARIPRKNSILFKKNQVNMSKVKTQQVSAHFQLNKCDETERAQTQSTTNECDLNTSEIDKRVVSIPQLESFSKKGKSISSKLDFTDIDSDEKDHLMCSLYASEIYSNLRVAELMHRPHFDFMETIQRDVTQSMRGVLVDWLVEVSEEYKLVPDTLYLTVYLIDSFLSQNYIVRQKLQLLGITCMLIASKYEELSAPSVEEFCFITDNTYSKSEVLETESQIMNSLTFRLSAPTAKTFLGRFIRAAVASDQSPSHELEFLANYLTELTLIDYNFLKFVPSTIAASAVFLARWMLDQSHHPWNHTLEYYTNYKPLDLKNSVLALHGLHSSDSSSPLTVIRSKYKQDKFKRVASFPSPELPETLF